MNTLLQDKGSLKKALQAFEMIRDLSESELETLEILSDPDQREAVLAGLEESKRNKVYPIKSIL